MAMSSRSSDRTSCLSGGTVNGDRRHGDTTGSVVLKVCSQAPTERLWRPVFSIAAEVISLDRCRATCSKLTSSDSEVATCDSCTLWNWVADMKAVSLQETLSGL